MANKTKSASGHEGRIDEDEFRYIQNNIGLMEARQKEDGGGIESGSKWNRYRRVYQYMTENEASVMGELKDADWDKPRIGYASITIDRQIPKLRFDNPEVLAKAESPEFEPIELQVANALTHELRHFVKLEDVMDDININALVTPYAPVYLGWNEREDMDESFMKVMDPEDLLYDPHLRGADINKAKMLCQRVWMSISEVRNLEKLHPTRFYNTKDIKPNMYPPEFKTGYSGNSNIPTIGGGLDPWENNEKQRPKGWKYHYDTVLVNFYYDGANKTVTAVPANAKAEIGHWPFPTKGITGYPFEVLQYNALPWQFCGLADMDRYIDIARELQKLEAFILAALKACVPKLIYDQERLGGRSLDKLMDETLWGGVGIDANGEDLRKFVLPLQHKGIDPSVIEGAERLRRELAGATTTGEIERTGQTGNIPTATQAQMVQMYTDIKTAYRLRKRDRFLSRILQKLHQLMVVNITKPRNVPWLIQERPGTQQGMDKKWSRPFTGKDLGGKFQFKLDLTTGEDGSRLAERKLFSEFMAIVGQWPLSQDTRSYMLRTAAKLFGMNPNRITIEQPQAPQGAPGQPPQGAGPERSPFSGTGGEAMAGAEMLPEQTMQGMKEG